MLWLRIFYVLWTYTNEPALICIQEIVRAHLSVSSRLRCQGARSQREPATCYSWRWCVRSSHLVRQVGFLLYEHHTNATISTNEHDVYKLYKGTENTCTKHLFGQTTPFASLTWYLNNQEPKTSFFFFFKELIRRTISYTNSYFTIDIWNCIYLCLQLCLMPYMSEYLFSNSYTLYSTWSC